MEKDGKATLWYVTPEGCGGMETSQMSDDCRGHVCGAPEIGALIFEARTLNHCSESVRSRDSLQMTDADCRLRDSFYDSSRRARGMKTTSNCSDVDDGGRAGIGVPAVHQRKGNVNPS
ncbi:hypothetical protein KC19_VG144900 [Ceratodon purpureus]|uniref:Uncharacterized protein n=1 Tax=Ceratodon purpureus TaxID=3225 RepID=A0A8T0HQI7_CERPU|nr:hypothetical protein KC19_VG144900 [Ceratodon purpureus]